jgi:hypothetical protein
MDDPPTPETYPYTPSQLHPMPKPHTQPNMYTTSPILTYACTLTHCHWGTSVAHEQWTPDVSRNKWRDTPYYYPVCENYNTHVPRPECILINGFQKTNEWMYLPKACVYTTKGFQNASFSPIPLPPMYPLPVYMNGEWVPDGMKNPKHYPRHVKYRLSTIPTTG